MKRIYQIVLQVILVMNGALSFAQSDTVQVRGAMFKIMRESDFSTHISLDTLTKTNLYALGPVTDLKGEIAVLDGKFYISTKNTEGGVSTDTTAQHDAAMLVYCHVKEWDTLRLSEKIDGFTQLQMLVEKAANEGKKPLNTPFPFMIKTRVQSLSYHIINWEKGAIHTMDNHKQFALKKVIENTEVTLIGFYSDHHHSIFTHHTTNMHIHLVRENPIIVGHVDNIDITNPMVLLLPK